MQHAFLLARMFYARVSHGAHCHAGDLEQPTRLWHRVDLQRHHSSYGGDSAICLDNSLVTPTWNEPSAVLVGYLAIDVPHELTEGKDLTNSVVYKAWSCIRNPVILMYYT